MTCTHVTPIDDTRPMARQSQIPTLNFPAMEIETNITGWHVQLSLQAIIYYAGNVRNAFNYPSPMCYRIIHHCYT